MAVQREHEYGADGDEGGEDFIGLAGKGVAKEGGDEYFGDDEVGVVADEDKEVCNEDADECTEDAVFCSGVGVLEVGFEDDESGHE